MATTWYGTLYDAAANHAKFYRLDLDEATGVVTATYGRVGAVRPQTATYRGGLRAFESKRAEKERKGYRQIGLADGASAAPVAKAVVAKAARKSLVSTKKCSPELSALIDRIAAANKHAITTATGGRIAFDTSGRATLPGGIVVTSAHVEHARDVLTQMQAAGERPGPTHTRMVERYFMLIPHAVGMGSGWADRVLVSDADFQREADLLDALASTTTTTDAPEDLEIAFRYTVRMATAKQSAAVKAEYERSANPGHPVAALQVKRVFVVTDDAEHTAAFDAKAEQVGNVKARWHGTATHNVLNILRTGLVIPGAGKVGGLDFHGALLGPGIYSSSMSTKAAGYGYGTWGGVRDTDCYVFLADVACGWEYRMNTGDRTAWQPSRRPDPSAICKRTGENRRFDSIEVYAGGTLGARNPETVVWDTAQVRLRYLVQLGAR